MDLNDALKWVDTAVSTHTGHALREPEIVILKGTWRGLTYEQMANDSEYSTNYLMRDVAPKLWKQLSSVFDRSVGKTNFRVALEAYASANPALAAEMLLTQRANAPDTIGPHMRGLLPTQITGPAGDGFDASALGDDDSAASQRLRGEASHGWLSENDGNWSVIGASLLSATSILPGVMYGYDAPLMTINGWLDEAASTEGWSRLIGVWGLRGIGKTLLVETAVSQRGDRFEGVVWRSLHDRPSLTDLSTSILASLGMSVSGQQATAQLLSLLSNRSLLIVLEGIDAILDVGSLAGDYPASHQAYMAFFQSVASSRSCVVLTGIEGPADLVRQGGYGGNQAVRSLTLAGLDVADAAELLDAERLEVPDQWPELIARYQGHPLALKSAARVIREIFNGRVDAFLTQSSVLFNGIFRLLSPSFERLSVPELNVIYWLASYDVPLSLAELKDTLPLSLRPAELISALDSLKQRSLLAVKIDDVDPPTFHLPALVKAYAVHQFMGQFRSQSDAPNAASTAFRSGSSGSRQGASYVPLDQVINLSPVVSKPVQLSSWFDGQFDNDWQPLDWLFESSTKPAMRLRSAYHLRDETYIKRCKAIAFGTQKEGAQKAGQKDNAGGSNAVLLVAVHQDTESLYKVCVQAQSAKGESILPQNLALKLLDAQQNTLATVVAEASDTFIQLPYFRGGMSETFEIEMALGEQTHTETFVI